MTSVYPKIVVSKVFGKKFSWWKLEKNCLVKLDSEHLLIPKGYVTNFASVPRIFYLFIPPHGLTVNPSIVHDYLYEKDNNKTRKQCDDIWKQLMKEAGVKDWQIYSMYIFVRIFGSFNWKKYKNG